MDFRRLTDSEREQWDRDGYFLVEDALTDAEMAAIDAEIDRCDELSRRHGREAGTYLDLMNIVDRAVDRSNGNAPLPTGPSQVFIDLLDHRNHLGLVCGLMGAAVHALATQVMIRPPDPKPKSRWHRDTMAPYGFPAAGGQLPLQQFRIGWFLTDMPEPDMGNFCVIPGSHRLGFPKIPAGLDHALRLTSFAGYQELDDICEGCPGAVQITLKRGDAVVFHNALFHAVSRNTSDVYRRNLYYVYGPWWARLSDRNEVSPEAAEMCSPVQKQLIGATLEPSADSRADPDERMPLIELFEGRTFQETFDLEVDQYIRASQG